MAYLQNINDIIGFEQPNQIFKEIDTRNKEIVFIKYFYTDKKLSGIVINNEEAMGAKSDSSKIVSEYFSLDTEYVIGYSTLHNGRKVITGFGHKPVDRRYLGWYDGEETNKTKVEDIGKIQSFKIGFTDYIESIEIESDFLNDEGHFITIKTTL